MTQLHRLSHAKSPVGPVVLNDREGKDRQGRAIFSEQVQYGSSSRAIKCFLTALDSDAALNVAWARRAGMISYLPRSAWVVRG